VLIGCAQEALVGPDAGRVRSRVTDARSLFLHKKTLTGLDRTLGWLCPVISSCVSGHRFDCALTNLATIEDQCAVFERGHVAPIRGLGAQRPDAEAAYGQLDRRVRSPRGRHIVEPNGSILLGTLINSWWLTLGDLSWHFDHLDILLS
jgi:hypothetical protein